MIRHLLLGALVSLGLTGCGGQKMKVYLTDAPLDGATAVNVTVHGLRAIGADGADDEHDHVHETAPFDTEHEHETKSKGPGKATLTFDEPRVYNLLELQNGVRTLLGELEVEGDLAQLRLLIDGKATVVYTDGTSREARVPSGAQTGIKILGIPAGAEEVTLDFDAGKSIQETGNGQLIMKPTIKALVDGSEVGGNEDETPNDTTF